MINSANVIIRINIKPECNGHYREFTKNLQMQKETSPLCISKQIHTIIYDCFQDVFKMFYTYVFKINNYSSSKKTGQHYLSHIVPSRVFSGCAMIKNPSASAGDTRGGGFIPRWGNIPWRRTWQPTPVFLSGKSHEQKRLVGYSSWGHKESDKTEHRTAQSG